MTSIDLMELATILRDVAAREILPRFRRLEPDTVRTKSNPTDLVTEADTEAERVIKLEIAKRWPQALVVGEESVAEDPDLLHRLPGANLAITLDPVDGTANFAAGLPLFAVMAAVVVKGEVTGGIIYDPMGDDWVMAERGAGAWMRHPSGWNRRLHVAAPAPLEQMVGTASMGFFDKAKRPQVLANLAKIAIPANYRVAGHEYRSLASGHTHFAVFNKLMPWDHLPGTLICAEAGAHVAHFDGLPYRVGDLTGGLLIATDRDSWSLLRREVFTV